MAEEHADELMVAHLDGRMRAAQPAGAQQPGAAYAELPSYEHQRAIMEAERNASLDEYSRIVPLTSTESMIYERAFTNGWNRHASHVQAPAQAASAAVAGPSEFPHEQMDVMALARYKVMPSHESMFHRHAVVAGDGSQQLYIGREVECENMARKFAGAFLDGAFAFHSMLAAAPTTQPAPDEIINMAREQGLPETETEGVFRVNVDDLGRIFASYRAARAPADSVTAPAAGAVAHTLSDAQIEAMPVWRNFVGLWPESRREIVDAVVDLLAAGATAPPAQAADSVLEDAARLDWLLLHISGAEFRRIGVHYSGNAGRADVDAARKKGANHD